MAHEQQNRFVRRLLQGFQQRIGGIAIEIIDAINNRHPPTALGRLQAEKAAQSAGVVDRDIAPRLALVIEATAQNEQIRMRQSRDAPRHGVRHIHIKRPRPNLRRAQQPAREAIGQCGLAQPLGPGDQPAMMHTPAGGGGGQLGFRRFMTDEIGGQARMTAAWLLVRFGRFTHDKRCSTIARAAAASACGVWAASSTAQRAGWLAAIVRNPCLTRAWKSSAIAS